MAMITPTRFGLKYGPIPTLALEYEEDLGLVENDDGTRSLYVFKETAEPTSRRVRKKLHVVELPQLTERSESLVVVRQLQKDNHKFLGPSVVKEQQLQRLLQQLLDHLPRSERKPGEAESEEVRISERVEPVRTPAAATQEKEIGYRDEGDEGDRPLGESAKEESLPMETSRANDRAVADNQSAGVNTLLVPTSLPSTGKFITQAESDDEDGAEDHHEDDDEEQADVFSPSRSTSAAPPPGYEDHAEAEEDEKKKKALKSESEASEEDDVQSEELEYFSEDGSDEDSF
jgi:hypothetical protein